MSTPPPLIGYDYATAANWRARLRFAWRDVLGPALNKWRKAAWTSTVRLLRRSAGLHPSHN